jgi:hypothetical protein
MTLTRAIAEYDGWIFSATGNSVQKGRNGTNRRLTDLHYDRWEWILPVYSRLCVECGDHRECMVKIQSAILLGDKEMVVELMGKLIMEIKKLNADRRDHTV